MSQYLGDISAYALAVSQGYTGTEEEYAELMASYATVGQTAVTAAQTATTKASEAATSATTATNKASEATTAATTATTKAAEAQADADAAALDASQALSAASTATTKATEATTAAATAVSAKDDAVSANTAAQSAKTAAQTAQTGAETAAASVQSSAEQIATNAEDISQLKSDLTATNAELADVRVGAEGTTYNSAGAAVRGQILQFSSPAKQINLINPTTIVDGEYWNSSTPASGSYSRSIKIPVKPSTAYTFANTAYNYWSSSDVMARFVSYFDETGTYLSREENKTTFTTPSTCAFVGLTFKQNAHDVVLIEGSYDATTQTMVYVPYVANTLKVDGNEIEGLTVNNIEDYAVAGKNLFDKSKAVKNKYLQTYPQITDHANNFVSDYIPVKADVSYIISHEQVANNSNDKSVRTYVLYDANYQKVSGVSAEASNVVITPTVDGYLRFCGYNQNFNVTQVEIGTTPTPFEDYKDVFSNNAQLNNVQLAQVGNILHRKKWAVLGDSFTAGSLSGSITSGRYIGKNCVYPYIIGNRNDMEIVKFFEGGRTLAFPANPDTFGNSVTNPNANFYYQNIPADVDYITIYLGINDEHHAPNSNGGDGEDNTGEIPIGTVDDSTVNTYLGAWNVVLTWLITNRPNAHIGIIVTNGIQAHDEYRQGQIAIAQKYGIPYIDLNGDARTPAMIRTSNPNIPSAVKQALVQKWAVNPSSNTHPNDDAHLFESTFIENFLRSI